MVLPVAVAGQQGPQSTTDPRSPDYLPPPDSGYDPSTDANHPLKDGTKDPGTAWEGHRRSDGTPALPPGEADWPWGDLTYSGAYETRLTVKNHCSTRQLVAIFVNDLPYLQIAPVVSIPANSELEVVAIITAPPEPDPPLLMGVPGEPGWGWVDPPLPSPAPDAPRFHQPNFVDVKGSVVAWHPWSGNCYPRRDTYTVTAHIHFGPPPGDPGPEKIAEVDLCMTYWLTGERPAQLDEDCTDKMRGYAVDWVERIVGPHAAVAPEEWGWLPAGGAIQSMSIDELLAMKARGDAQLAPVAEREAIP